MKREQFKYAKTVTPAARPSSKHSSIMSSRPSVTSSIRSEVSKQPSLTSPEPIIPTTAIQHLRLFENVRGLLLQWRYTNAFFKSQTEEMKANVEMNFCDRIFQLKELENQCGELRVMTLREEYIKELEDVLGIEYNSAVEIGREWDNFNDTLSSFMTFLANTLDKVFLGDRIVMEVEGFNEYLQLCEETIAKIVKNSHQVFEQDEELCGKIIELNGIIRDEMHEIREISTIFARKSEQKNRHMLLESLSNHRAYLGIVEAELWQEL